MSLIAPTLQAFFTDRLAAIHSFFRYAALEHPEHAQTIATVMAIPTKRYQHHEISYLDQEEITALLAAPERSRWLGRRDHALIQTGLRVSELTSLRVSGLRPGTASYVHVSGKGRKRRTVTLTHETAHILHAWLTERQGQPVDPLFPSLEGTSLSRDAVEFLLAKHATAAALEYPSLASKRVTPHVLRYTNAMLLRTSGVDIATIAFWLGHESITATQIYQHAEPRPWCVWRKKRSPGPCPWAQNPADTDLPTSSSPSSKASDYAEYPTADTPPDAQQHRPQGRRSA